MTSSLRIRFLGAAGTVTGSRFLLDRTRGEDMQLFLDPLTNIYSRRYFETYRTHLEVIHLEKENLLAAKENYEIAMERYLLGDLPGIEMREAQKSLLDAEERILTAKYNTKVCEISLQQISGNVMTYME